MSINTKLMAKLGPTGLILKAQVYSTLGRGARQTKHLRIHHTKPDFARLQQLWYHPDGGYEWFDVPIVTEVSGGQ